MTTIPSLPYVGSDTSTCLFGTETFIHWCDNNHLKLNVGKTQDDAKCIVADQLPEEIVLKKLSKSVSTNI